MQTTSRGKCGPIDRSINVASVCRRESEDTKRKSPLRVEGEWSEYISSKGLIYYYHCRTEVSQWQRPHEWTLPSLTHEEIKRKLICKNKNGISANVKRNCPIILSQDMTLSPKRIKFNNQQINEDKQIQNNNNFNPKIIKNDMIQKSKVNVQNCNNVCTNNIKNKNIEVNFNNDDMDISPNSSPMSRGSHSDECDKKIAQFNFESNKGHLHVNPNKNVDKIINEKTCKNNVSSGIVEASSYNKTTRGNNLSATYKYIDNGISTNLSQFQMSLVSTLRNFLTVLQSRNTDNKHELCLSVAHISELLNKFETVLNIGGTVNSYRSHRLQTQLLHQSSSQDCQGPKAGIKLSANIYQIKELIKYIQGFIHDNYPHSMPLFSPVSPNYSNSLKTHYYIQVLHNLVETCILQLDPQSLTSPCSTSSPGSSKDTNSTLSLCTSTNSHLNDDPNNKSFSPTVKEQSEFLQNKSILYDPEMLKFVSSHISNTYKNKLADFYVQEAQIEYYKFVRLHSVHYPELTCESKKLKALVRISEINTELFKHKKDDLERLVHMLDLRRLPNHLKCDYQPPPVNN